MPSIAQVLSWEEVPARVHRLGSHKAPETILGKRGREDDVPTPSPR